MIAGDPTIIHTETPIGAEIEIQIEGHTTILTEIVTTRGTDGVPANAPAEDANTPIEGMTMEDITFHAPLTLVSMISL